MENDAAVVPEGAPHLTKNLEDPEEILCLDEEASEDWSYEFSAANDEEGDKISFSFECSTLPDDLF